jgi:hypothetical protein
MRPHARKAVGVAAVLMLTVACDGRPASPTPSPSASSSLARAASPPGRTLPCAPVELHAGENVQGWRLGVLQFQSPKRGLALTAPSTICYPAGLNGPVRRQHQSVSLVATGDGGNSWRVVGTPLPLRRSPAFAEPRVAVAGRVVYVGLGRNLWVGSRRGQHWRELGAVAHLVGLTSVGAEVWALSCIPLHHTGECRPRLWRLGDDARPSQVAFPVRRTLGSASFLGVAHSMVAVHVSTAPSPAPRPDLVVSTDGGRSWQVGPAPSGPRRVCSGDGSVALVMTSDVDWTYLCAGGAAAGSETKAVLRTSDGGRTWQTRAAITRLDRKPRRANGLTFSDALGFDGAAGRLWLVSVFELQVSGDSGHSWRGIKRVRTGGANGTLDVLSSRRVWLLAPGRGLWRTTDGRHWHVVGRLNA